MGLLSSITGALSKAVTTVKEYASAEKKALVAAFLPSPDVAAARRLNTFGTTSKTVAGVAIVGTAAAAVLAAPAAAGVAARSAIASTAAKAAPVVGKSILSAAKANPILATAAVLSAPTVATAVIKNPKVIGSAAGAISDLQIAGINVAAGNKNILEAAKEYATDHPIATGIGAAVTAAAVISKIPAGVGYAIGKSDSDKVVPTGLPSQELTTISKLPTSTPASSSMIPLTPATQVVGRSVGTTKKRKATKKTPSTSTNIRFNIVNALGNKTYLSRV